MRIPVPWIFILTYLAGVGLEFLFPIDEGRLRPAGIGLAGGLLFVVGAALAGCGLWVFKKAHTTTVPGEISSKLVSWGPYRFSRNPMYVGLILAYLGEAGLLWQCWPVILLPLTIAYLNWVVIPLEEEQMGNVFGENYESYRMRVRRWL